MDSVLDFLFLRRLKFEYTTPPICPITLASASGLAITGQVISPILAMNAPFLQGRFLTWPCAPGQICFNIYSNQSGFLTEVATCIQPNSALVCSAGCWRASATVNGIEGPLTDPVCTDGTPIAVELPAQPGASYNLYHNPNPLDPFGDYTLALAGVFCGAFEVCTVGCYSISAITGDGETPPSDPTCTCIPHDCPFGYNFDAGICDCVINADSDIPYDSFEQYSNGVNLVGLNLGHNGTTPPAFWTPYYSYVVHPSFQGIQAYDSFESYSNGQNLSGLNGGTGNWSAAYVVH